MTKLTLDCSKWICGRPDPENDNKNYLGKGTTALLNKEGFMCCLGQFSLQLGVEESRLLNRAIPHEVIKYDSILTKDDGFDDVESTDFSRYAIRINDNKTTTVEEKMILLTDLCKKYDIELTIINKPN